LPVRNEAPRIADCLESLINQTYLPSEVWIINDHSEDDTLAIAQWYASRFPIFRVLSLPQGLEGKKAALRYGLAHTHAEIVITIDGDTVLESESLRRLVAPFASPRIQVAGGWIRLSPKPGFLNAFQRIEMAGVLMLTAGSWQRGEPLTANGALLAYRRTAFYAVGGWGEATQAPSGDDDLLVHRIVKHYGKRSLAFTSAISETQGASTWQDFFHQRLRWLSKRHHYQIRWTPLALGWIALVQITLPGVLLYDLSLGLGGWLLLSLWQGYIAYKGFYYLKAPLPSWGYWLLTACLYPFYQAVLGIWALCRPRFEWKGRTYR
jgi:glycosyltransferase involved in cell wall biosynthesis